MQRYLALAATCCLLDCWNKIKKLIYVTGNIFAVWDACTPYGGLESSTTWQFSKRYFINAAGVPAVN